MGKKVEKDIKEEVDEEGVFDSSLTIRGSDEGER